MEKAYTASLHQPVLDRLQRDTTRRSVSPAIMRRRITFLHKPEDGIDPAAVEVTDSSLTGPVLPSVREERVTLSLEELPDELRQLLESSHELHIRWVSDQSYTSLSPLYSRLSPGFHLFYTPQKGSHAEE